eukprot:gnl/MRDRNA2_/MRDRNA2_60455_c0_seq1.p1 gnl/MRDRNA2_/MRDRNA2_60455_c0~~gnl/MRDRNA2_/MRDRNA2_60455_c0_seq1.p1  ORF type:complete len:949 (-),score=268.30 gnl/MRDRNA2_/MRDRNA2_60455_c0_seq1:31-2877(-)
MTKKKKDDDSSSSGEDHKKEKKEKKDDHKDEHKKKKSNHDKKDDHKEEKNEKDEKKEKKNKKSDDEDEKEEKKEKKHKKGSDDEDEESKGKDGDSVDNVQYEKTIRFLERIPLFKRLPKAVHPSIALGMHLKKFSNGDTIIEQGDDGDEFFLIFEGKAGVLVSKDGGKKPKLVAHITAGDYFGEGALIKKEKRSATVRAESSLSVLAMTSKKFRELGLHQKLPLPKRPAIALDNVRDKADPEPEGPTEKSSKEEKLIADALKKNSNLSTVVTLDQETINDVVAVMWKQDVKKGEALITEGDKDASYFYVVQSGEFDIMQHDKGEEGKSAEKHAKRHHHHDHDDSDHEEDKRIKTAKKGDSFGELALLHSGVARAASVIAKSDAVVWTINRPLFKKVLMKANDDDLDMYIQILNGVSLLDSLLSNERAMVAEALQEKTYKKGATIIKQGEEGDTFFILVDGSVTVTRNGQEIETLRAAQADGVVKFFGERALLNKHPREATVECTSKKASCMTLDRDTFELLLGSLEDIIAENQEAQKGGVMSLLQRVFCCAGSARGQRGEKPSLAKQGKNEEPEKPMEKILRDDLKCLGLLGCGGFGKVTLEEHKPTGRVFALKALSKGFVVKCGMEDTVMNEKTILCHTDTIFIVKLHATFNGDQQLFFLLEAAMGGELYAVYLKEDLWGKEKHAQYYAATIICAFEYLHERRVIYRDLKPENVLLDKEGFAKLTDMGLAKMILGKTYTVCGTADYFAPETLKQTGHNRAVDWWATGVLLFIMMAGRSPFDAEDVLQIYKNIVKGFSKVKFPRNFPSDLVDAIKSLCRKKPEERITMQKGGVQNLKDHPVFTSFDWQSLIDQTQEAPFIPESVSYDTIRARKMSDESLVEIKDLQEWDGSFEEAKAADAGDSSVTLSMSCAVEPSKISRVSGYDCRIEGAVPEEESPAGSRRGSAEK